MGWFPIVGLVSGLDLSSLLGTGFVPSFSVLYLRLYLSILFLMNLPLFQKEKKSLPDQAVNLSRPVSPRGR
jgi:hypothetical protein